ncbi:MAG: hypothetical protein BGO25_06475 [Acidobacteriales bacterium 59-55]|nr:MAG: hypothetical protein BGO25_06475 [Acidobacteriales bacterium 59-55]
MHAPALHSTYASSANSAAPPQRASAIEFFVAHPVLPVLRGLFLSSLLWIALALALYGVYTLALTAL